jgi:hypothetical protein
MSDRLLDLVAHRPRTLRIDSIDGQIEAAYTALVAALEATTITQR